MSQSATNRKRLQQQGVALLRRTGLLPVAEFARLQIEKRNSRELNQQYLAANPDFLPPPDHLLHDAHGTTSYPSYLHNGKLEAEMLANIIRTHKPDAQSILDWGCGPGRILRHLSALLPEAHWFGADYNAETISWCSRAFPHIRFAAHGLTPPLAFSETFDVIYGISVLTHLSVPQQQAWVAELMRALNPGGILILTTHGESCIDMLTEKERQTFNAQGIVVRSGVEEGKRCYNTYQNADYTRNTLLQGLTIREYMAKNPCPHTRQEIWVIAK